MTGNANGLAALSLILGSAGDPVLFGRAVVFLLAVVQCGAVLVLFPYAYTFRDRSWQMIATLVSVFVFVALTFVVQLESYQWIESGHRPDWSASLRDTHDTIVTTIIAIEGLLSLIVIPSFISGRLARQRTAAAPKASQISEDDKKRSETRPYSAYILLAICVSCAALGTTDILGYHIFFRTPRILVIDSTLCCFLGAVYFGWVVFKAR
jgi:heme/copper-type cytochrome/quinol oxidase subunit 4